MAEQNQEPVASAEADESPKPGQSKKCDSFRLGKNIVELTFDNSLLQWKTKGKSDRCVQLCDILKAESSGTESSLVLHHVERSRKKRTLKHTTTVFTHKQLEQCQQWAKELNQTIDNAGFSRPKSLLVFLNPCSGKRAGPKAFKQVVAPIFELAGIKLDVILTEDGDHSRRVLHSYDLDSIDGVVGMGGDGTALLTTQSLLLRTMRDAGRNIHDPQTPVATPKVPIGILTGGTGNGMSAMTSGTYDVETAALYIALGETFEAGCMSVHNAGKLTAYTNFQVAYGALGDPMKTMEDNRQMGQFRLPYSLLKHIRPRLSDMEVHLLQENDDWHKVNGRYAGIECFAWNYKANSDFFTNLLSSWGTTDIEVHIMKDTAGAMGFTRHMVQMVRAKQAAFELDCIENHRTTGLRLVIPGFADSEYNSVLNLDGEIYNIQDDPTVELRLHKNSVKYFGAARERAPEE